MKIIASCPSNKIDPFQKYWNCSEEKDIRLLNGELQAALNKLFLILFIFEVAASINKVCSIQNVDFGNVKIHIGGLTPFPTLWWKIYCL